MLQFVHNLVTNVNNSTCKGCKVEGLKAPQPLENSELSTAARRSPPSRGARLRRAGSYGGGQGPPFNSYNYLKIVGRLRRPQMTICTRSARAYLKNSICTGSARAYLSYKKNSVDYLVNDFRGNAGASPASTLDAIFSANYLDAVERARRVRRVIPRRAPRVDGTSTRTGYYLTEAN